MTMMMVMVAMWQCWANDDDNGGDDGDGSAVAMNVVVVWHRCRLPLVS
jgi:hypothetical protein